MKRFIFSLILIISISTISYELKSNVIIDSLINELKLEHQDTTRVKILSRLSYA